MDIEVYTVTDIRLYHDIVVYPISELLTFNLYTSVTIFIFMAAKIQGVGIYTQTSFRESQKSYRKDMLEFPLCQPPYNNLEK